MSEETLKFGVIATGGLTLVLASALAFVMSSVRGSKGTATDASSSTTAGSEETEKEEIELDYTKYPGGSISVYFATQTGTAESFAKELEREGPEHGFLVHTIDLEEMTVEGMLDAARKDPRSGVARAILLAATYGEGEPTDNAMAFVQELKEKVGIPDASTTELHHDGIHPDPALKGLDFCVFGLGNRQYDHFNAMGKFFDNMLGLLGANRLAEIGLGDDDRDLEGDFESWRETVLWPTLKKQCFLEADMSRDLSIKPKDNNVGSHELPDCPYVVEYIQGTNIVPERLPLEKVHGQSRHYFTAYDCPVKVVRELRSPTDGGSTVHVEIDISNANGLKYETADNLGVLPLNSSSVVEAVAESLGYNLDAYFTLKAAPKHDWHGAPFPMPVTVREALTRYCDLTSLPLRSDLKLLAGYAQDPTDRKALIRMSSKEGKAEYKEKIADAHVGLVDLLKRCPSLNIPLEHLFHICPILQTRFYTISSSSSVHPDTVHLTVAVTKFQRQDGSDFNGVCSSHIANCKAGVDKLRVYNRASTFRLPTDPSRPIIMIGPGTGVAPMRALLQERTHQRTKLGQTVGQNILYFGCRTPTEDYIYEDELKAFEKSGDLNQLHLAFSRQGKEKVYVQHLLKNNSQNTWELINNEGAYVYVCGGVKMGHDVSDVLKEIFAKEGKLSADKAKEYFSKLTEEGRYVQELWS